MFSTNPAFNLKAVLKETGLAADTLRAWERRYGLPTPERSAGGHRLYSQRDIETIKWLIARQAEGLSISRAVDLWNEQTASDSDPLAGAASSALSTLTATPTGTSLDALRADWIAACLKFSETAAEQTLNQAFSLFPVEAVCMNILQKGLAQVGELWYENRANVQQEHFASALAMRRLDALLAASPAPSRKQTVIVGCPAEEWHAFTPLMLALLLRRRGLNVIYLGANVPTEQFAETAASVRADLVVLVAQTLVTAATLQQVAWTLASRGVRAAFGGRIFNLHPSLVDSIPAHFLGQSVETSLEETERVLTVKERSAQPRPISQEYAAARQFFTSKRAEIELTLRGLVQPISISPESLTSGITHLGNNIAAALQLGDMDYVSGEIEWLKTLVKAHERPTQELADFIASYASAVEKHINGSGRPICDWLSSEVDRLQKEK
ncbi:MAG: MerR family transcriptional regulator [Chloroflexota bacterium]